MGHSLPQAHCILSEYAKNSFSLVSVQISWIGDDSTSSTLKTIVLMTNWKKTLIVNIVYLHHA